VKGKDVMISMLSPFHEIANRPDFFECALERGIPRTKIVNMATSVHDLDSSINVDSLKELENDSKFRESMKGLLDLILSYCESKIEVDDEIDEENGL
jgi:hypothetical protein